MHLRLVRNLAKVALAGAVLTTTSACTTGVSTPQASAVADAYHTSDAIAISPYSRSIFSSTNF